MDAHFWAEHAQHLDWMTPWHTVQSGNFTEGNLRWFEGGELNVCVNCVDRHLPQHADKTALIWEADEPGHSQSLTFAQLHERVCRFANVLKAQGIQKGDRVCIYLPMIFEGVIAMLACARIGAVHSVVFGGFAPESIASRIQDAECCAVITADVAYRAGKKIAFKTNVDKALTHCPSVKSVIVVKHTGEDIAWHEERDIDYANATQQVSANCPAEVMTSEDPLFILYTSGSTGKPKGVLHTCAGYLLYASLTHKTVFDIQPDDVYWCTADIGWITGHSYIVYGPLANATTTVIFEGGPTYPDASRFWRVVDEHQVTVFYTAPTAIRLLMSRSAESLADTKRTSLRMLGSVGEPINPEAWQWYFNEVGHGQCPIMDTWWQTETGGFMLAPPHDINQQKPGASMQPFLGIEPVLLDTDNTPLEGEAEGALCIKHPWPGMMRTIYGDHQRFIDTYLAPYPGHYFSGDGARRDADGDLWITGRMDDVLNVSGHRLGTAELESALVTHPDVAEAAIIGVPHPIKGEGIYAFITLGPAATPSDDLAKTLNKLVRDAIGPIVSLDQVQWTVGVPKTRSGKIMRRLLRKIATGQHDQLGDTSTLANPDCIEELIKGAQNSCIG